MNVENSEWDNDNNTESNAIQSSDVTDTIPHKPLTENHSDSIPNTNNNPKECHAKTGRKEKIIILLLGSTLSILFVVSILGLLHFIQNSQNESNKSLCTSKSCIKAANSLLQNMDDTIDPCQDFYRYACGGFVRRIRIPDDRTSRSQFSIIDNELEQQLRDILHHDLHHLSGVSDANVPKISTFNVTWSSDPVLKEVLSPVFVQARRLYESCMNETVIEKIGLQPLRQMLTRFGEWPVLQTDRNESNFDWRDLSIELRKNGFNPDYILHFAIGTDIKNSTHRIIYFDEAVLGMNSEDLAKGFEEEDVKHYFEYMKEIAVALGADPEKADTDLRASIEFEIQLAKIALPREQRRNITNLYHPVTLGQLNKENGGPTGLIPDWVSYVNQLLTPEIGQVTEDERVVVGNLQYIDKLNQIVRNESDRNIANYMLWRVVQSSISFLNKHLQQISESYSRRLTGRTATMPRWKKCVGSVSNIFAAAIGKVYVLRHFDEASKESMLEMASDIRREFANILDEVTWMDGDTKELARRKLASIKEYIGYPEEILNNTMLEDLYSGLNLTPDKFYNNGVRIALWSTNYGWKQLREKIDKTDWKRHSNPAVVNAYYNSIENSIQFPAGILQGIFYSQDRPNYLNYGGIGWVIGHEITHGFDDQGREYDHQGNVRNWWDVETNEKFLEKVKCIIWQYGNYTIPEIRSNLNGVNTQGENIADNGGIKEAYHAYNNWVKRHGEEAVLPGLDLNSRQLFWLNAANTWCSKYRHKALQQRIKTGAHSPGKFRVLGPFSNSKEFAHDFSCPLGSSMNPESKCEVW